MELATVARLVFGAGVLALGAQNLLAGDLFAELQPVPTWVPARAGLAYLTGATVAGAAIALIAGRQVRLAARVLVVVFGLWLVALHLPRLAGDPRNGGAWTSAIEVAAFAAAAWLLAGGPRPGAARIAFGSVFVGMGVLHFRHADYVAYVIPAWIPAPAFWAHATGVAHAAAGLAIASGVLARLAAILLGAMIGSWVVVLHAPRVAANPVRPEWTSLFVALAMCGAAWVVAAAHKPPRALPAR